MLDILANSIFLLIPYLIYFIICFKLYCKKINIKTSITYFLFGIIPVPVIKTAFYFFPFLFQPINWNAFGLFSVGLEHIWITGIFFFFVQIALMEEMSKLISLKFGENFINKKNCLFQTMFYSSMIACGFSYVENITYVMGNSDNLLARMLLPSGLHILCGCIIGYFVGNLIEKSKEIKKFSFEYVKAWFTTYFVGIFAASTLHGIYNYSINYTHDAANTILFDALKIYPINLVEKQILEWGI